MYSLGNFIAEDGRRFAGLLPAGHEGVVALPEQNVEELLPTWDQQRARLDGLAGSGRPVPFASRQVLAPVRPATLLQSAANYRKHVVDLVVASRRAADPDADVAATRAQAEAMMDQRARSGMPFLFLGRPASMCGPYDDIVLPALGEHDWELELAVVMGRTAWHVSRSEALEYVAGFVTCNDLTTRDLVTRAEPGAFGADWFRAKNTPTFFPTGPWLVPAWFVPDTSALRIILRHNGDVMQDESTADMIYDVPRLIEFASATVPLQPGDVILTGSPAGNGVHWGRSLVPGDLLEGEITGSALEGGPGFGTQRNRCVSAVERDVSESRRQRATRGSPVADTEEGGLP